MNFLTYFTSYIEKIEKINEYFLCKITNIKKHHEFQNEFGKYMLLFEQFCQLKAKMKYLLSDIKPSCILIACVKPDKLEPRLLSLLPRIKKHESDMEEFISDTKALDKKFDDFENNSYFSGHVNMPNFLVDDVNTDNNAYEKIVKNLGVVYFCEIKEDIEKVIEKIDIFVKKL